MVGCYSELGWRDLAAIEGVDLIVGNQDKLDVLRYLASHKNPSPIVIRNQMDREDFIVEPEGGEGNRHSRRGR